MSEKEKQRAERNRTLTIADGDRASLAERLYTVNGTRALAFCEIENRTIHADLFTVLDLLPPGFADLIIIDPPYNLDKDFHGLKFTSSDHAVYLEYLRSWFPRVVRALKDTGSVYMCGDWRCSSAIHQVMEENVFVLNRITWQREKGRGAFSNWKNSMEDIWFGVRDKKDYHFDVEAVKMKRKVLAPYRVDGMPKDWEETDEGNFRMTYPSNFWDDISVPYWSMPENTDHPTQKPEKLIAKLILASCPRGGVVFDPFLGSGTTSVVAKKLGRRYVGIELNGEYCLWTEKRLENACDDSSIQGYADGVFWERNSLQAQKKSIRKSKGLHHAARAGLFDSREP